MCTVLRVFSCIVPEEVSPPRLRALRRDPSGPHRPVDRRLVHRRRAVDRRHWTIVVMAWNLVNEAIEFRANQLQSEGVAAR